jgi:hypothetical protein
LLVLGPLPETIVVLTGNMSLDDPDGKKFRLGGEDFVRRDIASTLPFAQASSARQTSFSRVNNTCPSSGGLQANRAAKWAA